MSRVRAYRGHLRGYGHRGSAGRSDGCPPATPNCATGSAYIFQRDVGGINNWAEVAKLTAADAAANDQFGVAAATDGDVAVVGAFAGDGLRGAAYVFVASLG